MNGILFYPYGGGAALACAAKRLEQLGCNIADRPCSAVTHLLLPVPSFDSSGHVRGGGDLDTVLSDLSDTVTIMGGNLRQPMPAGCKAVDLLQDQRYLAENAAITADCALRIAHGMLPVTLAGCPVLILGWGRIGKCLAKMLKSLGAEVTIAVRKDGDLAMLAALGYKTERIERLHYGLMRYRVIYNTVPCPVLSEEQVRHCRRDCIKIDLASSPGIAGDDVVHARGLPGKDAPESSGLLIAKTILRLVSGKE